LKEMDINEKRKYIQKYLDDVDENTVNELYSKLYSVLEKSDPVVGYDSTGNPIKKKQFIDDIKQAESQIENGDFITLEQLKKESKDW
jgi:hypothetical protein